jgi:hypothetical protein
MNTTDDIKKWIDGEEEEINQFLTDDAIIEKVKAEKKDDDRNYGNKGG